MSLLCALFETNHHLSISIKLTKRAVSTYFLSICHDSSKYFVVNTLHTLILKGRCPFNISCSDSYHRTTTPDKCPAHWLHHIRPMHHKSYSTCSNEYYCSYSSLLTHEAVKIDLVGPENVFDRCTFQFMLRITLISYTRFRNKIDLLFISSTPLPK